MDNARISRRLLVGAGAVGTLGLLIGPEAALADGDDLERVNRLRWDLVQPKVEWWCQVGPIRPKLRPWETPFSR
jgi:hypothetical protein